MQNWNGTTRARARVKTANMLGIIDDATNSTLYKAMLTAPSDPIPADIGPTRDTVQSPTDSEWDQHWAASGGFTATEEPL